MFFVGDSAGHCLPLTAEGIRTAFYFGIACGRELRAVLEGARSRARRSALRPLLGSHRWKYERMLDIQRAVPRLHPRALGAMTRGFGRAAVSHWAFRHYLRVAPPEFALPAPPAPARATRDGRLSATRAAPADVRSDVGHEREADEEPLEAHDLAPRPDVVEDDVGERRPGQQQEAERRHPGCRSRGRSCPRRST